MGGFFVRLFDPPTIKRVLSLAAPVTLGMMGQNVLGLADYTMISRVSADAMAGFSVSGVIMYFTWTLAFGVAAAVNAITARRIGAGDDDKASDALSAALIASLFTGITIVLGLNLFASDIFRLFGATTEVTILGAPYLTLRAAMIPIFMMLMAFTGFYRGIGRTTTIMIVLGGMCLVNIGFDYVLIFGKFGFPRMGLMGIAVGSISAVTLGTLCFFALHLIRRLRGDVRFKLRPAGWGEYRQLIRIGFPAAAEGAVFAGTFTVFTGVVTRTGTVPVAASGACFSLMTFPYSIGIGLGTAAGTLVGQGLGADDIVEARRSTYTAAMLSFFALMIVATIFALFSFPIGRIVSGDADVARTIGFILLVGAASLPLDSINMVLYGALQGAGDTRWLFLLRAILGWVFFVPLVLLLALVVGWGVYGAWSAMAVLLAILAGVQVLRFRGEKWTKDKIS